MTKLKTTKLKTTKLKTTTLKINTLVKTAAIAAFITGFANSAVALDVSVPLENHTPSIELFETTALAETKIKTPSLERNAKIAVARLDGGRLIPTPYGEEVDWTMLDKRSEAEITMIEAGTHLKYTPEIKFNAQDTDNKIDEVRITAAAEGFPYVLIYGVGPDASWASFGGKALRETGLTVQYGCESWQRAKAKALLVNSFTGEVLGAATAENIEFNIGELADNVHELVNDLSKA